MLGLIMLLIIPFENYDKINYDREVEFSFKSSKNKFCYVVTNGEDLSLETFDKEPKINGKIISYQEEHPAEILSLIAIITFSILIIIGTISTNSDMNWSYSRCYAKACVSEVICEFEEGYYYYQFEGRLIFKDKYTIDLYSARQRIEGFFTNGKNLYPEFLTKEQRRDKKLKEILS
jgi:hypothetical protein